MSVFISWTSADREVKNVIAGRLREENIVYWESDEHCCSDFSKECIKAIRRSSVFIVIVSNEAMDEHSYVISEVLAARQMENDGKLNILVYKVCDEPYTERFEMQLNHISDANRVSRLKKVGACGGIDSIIMRVKHLLKVRNEGFPEKPYDVLVPRVTGTEIARNGYFVEHSRDVVLEKIREGFNTSNVIILSELFGFGKKSVVHKYVEEQGRALESATEVEAMRIHLRGFFANILNFSNINEAAFDALDEKGKIIKKIEFLKKLDEKHLVVVSDVDLGDAVDEFVCSCLNGIGCKIILITQGSAHAYRDIYPVISVGRMENVYLQELFFHHYNRANEMQKEALGEMLETFFNSVGGHTKTVELTASVLSRELLAAPDKLSDYLAVEGNDSVRLHDRIVQQLSNVLELEKFSTAEETTLLLAVLLAVPTVNEKTLLQLMRSCGVEDPSVIVQLDNRRWISYNPMSGTVYVEPIIAYICVRMLLKDDVIPMACLNYYMETYSRQVVSGSMLLVNVVCRLEHFFDLLQQQEVLELIKAMRLVVKADERGAVDADYLKEVCARFEENFDASEIEQKKLAGSFAATAKSWAREAVFPMIKINANYNLGTLLSFNELKNITTEEVSTALAPFYEGWDAQEVQEVYAEIDAFLGAYGNVASAFESAEDESYAFSIHCLAIIDDCIKRRFEAMTNKLELLLDRLYADPVVLEDEDVRAFASNCFRIIWLCYSNTNLHRSAVMFFEKVLSIDWPPAERFSFLQMYIKSIGQLGDGYENALFAFEMAFDVFDEAVGDVASSPEDIMQSKKVLTLQYAATLCAAGDVSAAIEQFHRAKDLGVDIAVSETIQCADVILNKLIYSGERESAIAFVTKNEALFLAFSKSENDEERRIAETALSIGEMFGAGATMLPEKGGFVENESYYQKYASSMGNNPFAMMKYNRIADGAKRFDFSALTDAEIAQHTATLRRRAQSESKMKLAPEAFALVSEAGIRVLGYKHLRVQYVGAAIMLEGKIAEILNGEGKTYTIPLVAYLCCLFGERVLIVDDSKYLSARNFRWMRGVFEMLGLETFFMRSKDEDDALKRAFDADITYVDLATLGICVVKNELGDEASVDLSAFSVIFDEADTILIDKALTDIQLLKTASHSARKLDYCNFAFQLAMYVGGKSQFYDYCNGGIRLKNDIYPLIEEAFGISYEKIEDAERINEAERLVKLAIHRCFHYEVNKHYFIKNNRIYFENKLDGTMFEARAVDGFFLAKKHKFAFNAYQHGVSEENKVLNTTFVYGLLQKFGFVCGTSATVSSFKKEFKELYDMEVVAVPPARPIQRKDLTVTLFLKEEYKNEAILDLICEKHEKHQPILLVTDSIRASEIYSDMLQMLGIEHKVLNAINSEKSPEILAEAGSLDAVLIATAMANRGVDIKLGGDPERMACKELVEMGIDVSKLDDMLYRRADEGMKQTELYRCYMAALEKFRALTSRQREQVLSTGGLCVISVQPYSDMRIEQQIRGRSGRQGDPGESYIFECITDEVFESVYNYRLLQMCENLSDEMEIVNSRFLEKAIVAAQKRLHHARYVHMKDAAEAAMHIEDSKRVFIALKDDLYAGVCSVEDILRKWSRMPGCLKTVRAVLQGQPEAAEDIRIRDLMKDYPEVFADLRPSDFSDALVRAAKKSIEVGGLTYEEQISLLITLLLGAWIEHLQIILYDLQMKDADMRVKKSKARYAEKYEADINERFAATIGKFISARKRRNEE